MKFALCLFNYFPFGGLQRDFLRIAEACQQRGHVIDVYTTEWEGPNDICLNIHLLPTQRMQNHARIKHFGYQLQNKLKHIRSQYDAILGFNKMPGLDFYYAADGCLQERIHASSFAWFKKFLPHYRTLLDHEKAVFAKESQTRILFISQKQQQYFQHYYQTPDARFHFIPPGVSRDRIAGGDVKAIRNRKRNELNVGESIKLLLMIGSGFKVKGVDRTLRALAALPEEMRTKTQVCIVGQDNPVPYIRLSKQLAIENQVRFLGGRDDIPEFLFAADLLLHPAYYENTGTVLLEALVAGLPVLTTDVCGYAHYIQAAEAGVVLSSPFQQADLNDALLMMLSTENKQWGQNGLRYASQADIYDLPQHVVNILEKNAQ